MSWLLDLLAKFIAGGLLSAIATRLADGFAGACPLEPTSFVCAHWSAIAGVGGAVLGVLGYGKAAEKFRASGLLRKASPGDGTQGKRVTDVLPDAPAAGDAPAAEGAAQPAPGAPDSIVSEQDRDRIWGSP